ncbi:type II secretion system F family protein [Herbaspirillum sp. AP02]|uniref:type II secretion system F family protein n=1 Tax=unclassified Herbaspirillum TaxID=2624150 RepID=UPI0015D9F882|nr:MULTISPECIES: type II secretion system F family protein [unclassified Herbaspirillum]MBG7620314.1 type II secretion system F family protein [Herbaspirillum sp. AP02]NZD67778.1 type II secretion system F family protein [Herbaspirillum sp. AP21]
MPAREPPRFQWEGLDRHGRPQRGVLQAVDEAQARANLRRQGLRVARLRREAEAGAGAGTSTGTGNKQAAVSRKPSRGRISDKQIALFTRQLATMLQAGLPLLQSLDIAIRGAGQGPLAGLLAEVRQQVSRGDSLHAALQGHPRHFDALFCNLVRAAEEAGMLDSMLERIALYREKSLALRGKVRAALAYPGAVVLVAIIVTAVIMLWVVPAFEQMFQQFGAELPLPTRIVMALARMLGRYWPLLLLGLAASGLLAMHAWRRYPVLRARAQRLSLSLPIFGRLLRQAALARWSRTFGTLFGAGIALVEALETVAGAAGNVVFAEASLAVRDAVRNGASLHGAMQATGVFPDLAVQMTAVGEEAGALDTMLGKIAELNEREVDEAVSALTSLMEPVIMAVLGVVIGALVVAMYLPVFRMGAVV